MTMRDPEVMKYAGNGKLRTKEEVQRVLNEILSYQEKHEYSMCAVFEKESGMFIGQAGLFHIGFYEEQPEIELVYRLHKKFWGKGYGALIQWGFDHLSVTKLVAFVDSDNIASHRILQRCRMINMGIVNCYYGELVKYEIYKNDSIELVPYNSEWVGLAALEIKKLHDLLPKKHILDIQHIGSTAIPGIQAKPIIDIQIAVDSLVAIKQTAEVISAVMLAKQELQDNLKILSFIKKTNLAVSSQQEYS
jgi:RimJ/RimL family protein N-acetyltransferase